MAVFIADNHIICVNIRASRDTIIYISEIARIHINERNIQADWIEDVLKQCDQFPCGVFNRNTGWCIVKEIETENARLRMRIDMRFDQENGPNIYSPIIHSICILNRLQK